MHPPLRLPVLRHSLNELRAPASSDFQRTLCFSCRRALGPKAKVKGYSTRCSRKRPDSREIYPTSWPRLCPSRNLATVQHSNPDMWGPLDEYDARVRAGKLKDDEHQRGIVQSLQDLHDMLIDYHAPKVIRPSIESLKPPNQSFLGSIFHRPAPRRRTQLPANLPKGLYMYGDVGSGKTMLMDMFYDTLPHNITSKTRIHFHNFMQDVHKRLHAMKLEHGTDLDAVQYVAADIAENGSVLCFDEFQCTDVADAMILRRCVRRLFG